MDCRHKGHNIRLLKCSFIKFLTVIFIFNTSCSVNCYDNDMIGKYQNADKSEVIKILNDSEYVHIYNRDGKLVSDSNVFVYTVNSPDSCKSVLSLDSFYVSNRTLYSMVGPDTPYVKDYQRLVYSGFHEIPILRIDPDDPYNALFKVYQDK